MSPTVAVLGASVRPPASSLQRAGFRVIAADLFADADLAAICPVTQIQNYPAEFADWLERTPCDGWLYTGALENYPDLIDHLATLRPLWGNAGPVIRRVRDPLALQTAFGTAGLKFPETRPCEDLSPPLEAWIHKTGRGGGGSGVSLANTRDDRQQLGGYWQRQIDGASGAAVFLGSRDQCTLLGTTEQLVGTAWLHASRFAYCGSIFPWRLPDAAAMQLTMIGQLLVEQIQLRGLFGVDFLFDGHDVWPVEVNPRPTAAVEVVEGASDRSLIKEHVQAFTQAATAVLPIVARDFRAKAILFAPGEVAVTDGLTAQMLAAARRNELADVPRSDQMIPTGAPICTILARADTRQTVELEIREKVASWEAVIYGENSCL